MQRNSSAEAWVMRIGKFDIAISAKRLQMLVDEPSTAKVVGAPTYAEKIMFFQNKQYPVLNVGYLLGVTLTPKMAGVIAYRNEEHDIEYGAIELSSIPEKVPVEDSDSIELKELPERLRSICNFAFTLNDRTVGLIDFEKLFNK